MQEYPSDITFYFYPSNSLSIKGQIPPFRKMSRTNCQHSQFFQHIRCFFQSFFHKAVQFQKFFSAVHLRFRTHKKLCDKRSPFPTRRRKSMLGKTFFSSSIITYQDAGKNFHHFQGKVNIPCTDQRKYLMNGSGAVKAGTDTM